MSGDSILRTIDGMPDDPDKPDDFSKNPIDLPLNSPPVLEQSVWAKLLTRTIQIHIPQGFAPLDATIQVPKFDFPKVEVAHFEFPKIEFPKIDLPTFDIKLPEIDFDHAFRTMEDAVTYPRP